MAAKPLTREQMQEAVDAVYVHGSQSGAARALGLNRLTLVHRYERGIEAGLKPTPGLQPKEKKKDARIPEDEYRQAVEAVERYGGVRAAAYALGVPDTTLEKRYRRALHLGISSSPFTQDGALRAMLARGAVTLGAIAQRFGVSRGQALDMVERLRDAHTQVVIAGDTVSLMREHEPAYASGQRHRYVSRPDNTFVFGVTSDNHLGSKYAREDCLQANYDRFAAAGVDRVFNCGNWIEGESTFNRTSIHVHGFDAQIRYLVERYPRRDGIVTYAIWGDDHEGWYAQREGIDVGGYAEQKMREAGRADWINLGFMEAHVELVNANTGKSSIMAVVHPGGGNAYADSYVIQRLIESLEGGEKPAVGLYGHYHKLLSGEYRNVWWVLVPSTKDQDPFLRKHRIRSVVGGGIITLEQDPETGAIVGMTPQMWRYFVTDYYRSWSHHSMPLMPKRALK